MRGIWQPTQSLAPGEMHGPALALAISARFAALHESLCVQVFGRLHDDLSTRADGRRRKSAKARSRGRWSTVGAAGATLWRASGRRACQVKSAQPSRAGTGLE